MRRFLLAMALLLPAGVSAQETIDPEARSLAAGVIICYLMLETDDAARLACYDRELAEATADAAQDTEDLGVPAAPADLSAAPTESGMFGQWKIDIQDDPMDDRQNVFVMLLSSDAAPSSVGSAESGGLVFRCLDDTTSVLVTFPRYMGSRGQAVRFRIDGGEPFTQWWSVSTDGKTLGAFYGIDSIPFIRSLFDHTTLVVEASPFERNPMTLTFDIADVELAHAPVAEACHWPDLR